MKLALPRVEGEAFGDAAKDTWMRGVLETHPWAYFNLGRVNEAKAEDKGGEWMARYMLG